MVRRFYTREMSIIDFDDDAEAEGLEIDMAMADYGVLAVYQPTFGTIARECKIVFRGGQSFLVGISSDFELPIKEAPRPEYRAGNAVWLNQLWLGLATFALPDLGTTEGQEKQRARVVELCRRWFDGNEFDDVSGANNADLLKLVEKVAQL